MKKTLVIIASIALSGSVMAQTADDGIRMYRFERYQSAEKILMPLAASNPNANYYLGLSQLADGNTDMAKTTFNKYPDDAANMAGLARIAYMQGNAAMGTQLAMTVAGKAKKKEWLPYEYAADAITYTTGGDVMQAINWYKEALKNTDDANVHLGLGDAYQKLQGGGGDAMNNYESVTGKDPKNSLAYSKIGALWYAAHNYQSALDNYSKAKEADSTNPIPYRDLANAYYWVGKYDLALQNIQQYIRLSDKSVDDEVQYADILYLSKHYPEAIQTTQQLIQSGTVKPGFYGILAYSQYETHDSANALTNVRTYFAKQDPKKIYPSDYLNYGKILMANKMNDSADYYFNKSVAADTSKDKSNTYRQIAEGFKENKEYTKAAYWYNRLVTENPGTQPLDYFWAGVMYYYVKDYKNADEVFAKMETKYPDQPSATYWRGRVAAANDAEGKEGTAVPYFTKWLTAVGPNYDKKNDLKLAYEYLLLTAYNKKDKAAEKEYMDKVLSIDPNDSMVKQIQEADKAGAGAPAKKTAAKK